MDETRERFLKVSEVARRCAVSKPTIYRRISEGQLPAVRVGDRSGPLRVDAAELERWLYSVPPRSRADR
jgi:excisionase family DNA binding protein